jgi:hypothetical protein
LNNICDVFEVIGQYDTAFTIYEQAHGFLDSDNISHKPVLLMTYFNIAEYYFRRSDHLTGIAYLQKIYTLYSPGSDYSDIYINPSDPKSFRRYYLNLILFYKARAFYELYKQDTINGIQYLRGAFDCYDLAGRLLDEEKDQINNYDDLLSFISRHASLMLEIAKNSLLLYDHTHDEDYVTVALQYMEKSKNLSLLSGLSASEVLVNDIPEEWQMAKKRIQDDYL